MGIAGVPNGIIPDTTRRAPQDALGIVLSGSEGGDSPHPPMIGSSFSKGIGEGSAVPPKRSYKNSRCAANQKKFMTQQMQNQKGGSRENAGRKLSKLLRWTLNQAALEFGAHRETLERRRRALSIEPGADGNFSSKDIASMLFGDKEAETIGKIAAERKSIEMDNARRAGELIPTSAVIALCEKILVPIRQKICSASMPDDEKNEMLSDLVTLGEIDWAARLCKTSKSE